MLYGKSMYSIFAFHKVLLKRTERVYIDTKVCLLSC